MLLPPPAPPAGPTPQEPGEPLRPAAEDRGGGTQVVQRGRPLQDGKEEETEQLPGRHEEAGGDREGNQRLQSEEGEDAHAESLTDLRR